MNKSEQINELAKALALAQGEMENPPLDGENPHFKSRFTTLAAVRQAVYPVFAKHGLSVVQSLGANERGPTISLILMHVSGQWLETDMLTLPAAKQDSQAYGSAITYGRRFSLLALAGVVGDDDDDAQGAVRQPAKKQSNKTQAPKKPDPTTPTEFNERLDKLDAWAVEKGLFAAGELSRQVMAACSLEKFPQLVKDWSLEQLRLATDTARHIVRTKQAEKKPTA